MIGYPALNPIATVPPGETSSSPRDEPTVTVVIPNYNYARFLPQSVGSSLAQAGVKVDVVIVDDASPDDSAEVIRSLADADDRIRFVLSPENRKAVATFNTGLEMATGEYLVRLDADDLLPPGALARSVALAESFPDVSFVYGEPVHFHGDPPETTAPAKPGWTVWNGGEWLELRCRMGLNCITSPEVVMRGSAVAKVGGQRPDLPHSHDMEMWFRLATVGDVGHVDGPPQGLHREHAASLSAREVNVLDDLHHRQLVYEKLLDAPTERNAQLLDLARRALASEALVRMSQAYAAGRGDTDETAAYLDFARSQNVTLEDLESWPTASFALRLGPRRARRSPRLIAHALRVRRHSRLSYARTRRTGL